jgi:two-component system nitrogen regulation sensor histidine kinase GlnL
VVSQKIHHFLIDNLNTAVLLLDEHLTVEYANAAFEALLQVSSSRLKGIPASALFRDGDNVLSSIEASLASGRPYTRRHEFLDTYSAGPIKVDYSGIPIELDGEKKLLMELQPIDRFLKINREEAMLSVQDTSKTLIRGLAHEIKNPLGGIRGAAQLLDDEIAEQSLDSETRELCQIIMTETDRLRNLVDRLLGPNQVPTYTQISIHEVTERVVVLMQAELQGQIEIIRDYDPSIPPIEGDAEQLIQAVLNVARNAMQALIDCEQDQPKITFRTRVSRSFTIAGERHKMICKIEIIDNGPGVSEEIKEQIFFPMISGRKQGTGLGLTIAQNAVNGHQGTIECDSRPGDTCFSIYLPIKAQF